MKTDNKYNRKYYITFDAPVRPFEKEYQNLYYDLIYKGNTVFDQMSKEFILYTSKSEKIGNWDLFRKYNPKYKNSTDEQLQEILSSYNTNKIDELKSNPPQEIIEFYNEHFLVYFDYEFTNIFGKPIKIEDNYSTLFIEKEQLIENIVDPEINNVPENQKEAYLDHIYKQYVGMVNQLWD